MSDLQLIDNLFEARSTGAAIAVEVAPFDDTTTTVFRGSVLREDDDSFVLSTRDGVAFIVKAEVLYSGVVK